MIRNRSSVLVLSLLLLPLTACVTYREQQIVGSPDYVLAQRELPDGSSETYRIQSGAGGDASLLVSTAVDRERPFLGFQLREIDKAVAERHGLRPYSGLFVDGVYEGSAAQAAGVRQGDVLYSIGERDTTYLSHVVDAEARLDVGEPVVASIGRGGERLDLPLTVKLLEERVTNTESVALEASQSRRPYAGVHLRGIPEDWCEKIYGEARNAVVVGRVEVGSPAWIAGIRGGDIIDEVDGKPVPPLSELSREIASRGRNGDPMRVTVSRAGSPSYEAEIDLHDYSGETNVWVPLIFKLQDGVFADRWTIGPWGLIMSNKNTYVSDSSTRETETRNVFHALLGLIKVDSRPDETRVRLLWIISFDT